MIARIVLIVGSWALATLVVLSRTARRSVTSAVKSTGRAARAPIAVPPGRSLTYVKGGRLVVCVVVALGFLFIVLALNSDPVYWGG